MYRYLFIALISALALAGCSSAAPTPTPEPVTPSPATPAESTVPSSWVKYQSPRYAYSFAYPPEWFFLPFDETNPEIVSGTHTLVNYDPSQVEQYADHGLVDWEAFLGSAPAVKLDIAVQPLAGETPDEAKKRLLSEDSTPVPQTDMQIGSLETSAYTSTIVGGPFNRITSYMAVSGDKLINIHRYLANTSPEDFTNTQAYQSLKGVFQSFSF